MKLAIFTIVMVTVVVSSGLALVFYSSENTAVDSAQASDNIEIVKISGVGTQYTTTLEDGVISSSNIDAELD